MRTCIAFVAQFEKYLAKGFFVLKRLFDIFFSAIGILFLLPMGVLVAILIKLDSAGPVFFRQVRVGRGGALFRIHKFRTMITDAERKGLQITVGGTDPRVTRVGYFLRKYKVDELPQLIDVLRGVMSFVGPRPEVPKYVELYPADLRDIILSVRPGITDQASIEMMDENDLLANRADPEQIYINEIMPIKIRYYVEYVQRASLGRDLRLIALTLKKILSR